MVTHPDEPIEVNLRQLMGRVQGGTEKRKKKLSQIPDERYFGKLVGKILREDLGLFSYQTAEKFYHGIPDRYVAGGNWIEFKKIAAPNRGGGFAAMKFVTPKQRNILDAIWKGNDRAFIFVVWVLDGEEIRFSLMEWWRWKEIVLWDEKIIREHSFPHDAKSLSTIISSRFGKQFERFSSYVHKDFHTRR